MFNCYVDANLCTQLVALLFRDGGSYIEISLLVCKQISRLVSI